jgi:hypothetical protein
LSRFVLFDLAFSDEFKFDKTRQNAPVERDTMPLVRRYPGSSVSMHAFVHRIDDDHASFAPSTRSVHASSDARFPPLERGMETRCDRVKKNGAVAPFCFTASLLAA